MDYYSRIVCELEILLAKTISELHRMNGTRDRTIAELSNLQLSIFKQEERRDNLNAMIHFIKTSAVMEQKEIQNTNVNENRSFPQAQPAIAGDIDMAILKPATVGGINKLDKTT